MLSVVEVAPDAIERGPGAHRDAAGAARPSRGMTRLDGALYMIVDLEALLATDDAAAADRHDARTCTSCRKCPSARPPRSSDCCSAGRASAIPHQKVDLLRNRLGRRLVELRLGDFEDYAELLAGPQGSAEAVNMVEALTTHTTSFFREGQQYRWMRTSPCPR